MRYQMDSDESVGTFRKKAYAACSAIVFSSLTTLGFCSGYSEDEIVTSFIKHNINYIVLMFLICLACFYTCFLRLFSFQDNGEKKAVSKILDYKTWMLASIFIFICWTPYLVYTAPAITVGFDYSWQLMQGLGALPFSNHHPVLSSIVFGLLYRIGYLFGGAFGGLLFTSIMQAVLMASVLGLWISTFYNLGVPKTVLALIEAFFCLNPVYITNCLWLIKDSIFASLTVLFFWQIFCSVESLKNGLSTPTLAKTGAVIAIGFVLSNYRNGVMPIVLMTIVLQVLVIKIASRDQKALLRGAISIAAILLLTIGWGKVLDILDTSPTDSREALSLINKQVINTLRRTNCNVSATEKEVIKKAYHVQTDDKLKSIVAKYNPNNADRIKTAYGNDEATNYNYIISALKLGLEYPGCYIDATLKGTDGYWWIGCNPKNVARSFEMGPVEKDFAGKRIKDLKIEKLPKALGASMEDHNINTKVTYYDSIKKCKPAKEAMEVKSIHPDRSALTGVLNQLTIIPIVSMIFVPAFYLYVIMGALLLLMFRRYPFALIFLPILMFFAMACLSPIDAYMRYVLQSVVMAPLVLTSCFVPCQVKG